MSARNPTASDFVHDEARVGPIIAPDSELRLEGDCILWSSWRRIDHSRQPYRELKPQTHVFRRFLQLHDDTDEAILSFAQRNGVLGLCKHGLPICHGPRDPQDRVLESGRVYCTFGFTRSRAIMEPLKSWRALSREALVLLTLRRMLEYSGSHRGRDEIWKDALWLCLKQSEHSAHPGYRSLIQTAQRTRDRERIALIANEWLRCGRVELQLKSGNGGYRFNPVLPDFGPNLFGYIAFQLAANLTNREGWAICASCKEFFEPTNTISPGRRTFCQSCRSKGKPLSFSMIDYRARIKLARKMYESGRPVAEIATALQRPQAQIRKWVRSDS